MTIKLYADGADFASMVNEYKRGVVSGFTTNPTLMKKAGVINYKEFAKAIIRKIPDMPISFEVFADDLEGMEREARIISSWGENIYVKIPITNTKGVYTYPIIETLSEEIKLNITAILTDNQVSSVINHIGNQPTVVSIFAGRIADTGRNPEPTMYKAVRNTNRKKTTEILWASTREVLNVVQAEDCGCDIITVPNDILKKLSMRNMDLNELSLDTVKMFHDDAVSAGYNVV